MKYLVLMVFMSFSVSAQDGCEPSGELFFVAITESNDDVIKVHGTVGVAGCPVVAAAGTDLASGEVDDDSYINGNRYLVFFTGINGGYKMRLTLIQSLINKSPYPVSKTKTVDLHGLKRTTFSQDFELDSDNTGVFDFELNGWEYNFVVKGMR